MKKCSNQNLTYFVVEEDLEINKIERTGKVEIRMGEHPEEAGTAILTYSRLERENLF